MSLDSGKISGCRRAVGSRTKACFRCAIRWLGLLERALHWDVCAQQSRRVLVGMTEARESNLDKVCAAGRAIWHGAEQLNAHKVRGFLHHRLAGLPVAHVGHQLNGGAVTGAHRDLTETHRVRCLRTAPYKGKGHRTRLLRLAREGTK